MANGSWLKKGCLGCGGVFVLGLLAIVALFAVAAIQVRSDEPRSETFQPEISSPTAEGAIDPTDASADEVIAGIADGTLEGQLTVEVTGATLDLRRADLGEALSIEANYSEKGAEFEKVAQQADDGSWEVTARLERKGGLMMSMIRGAFGQKTPQLVVRVPPDLPVRLDMRVMEGATEVDLGGMALRELDVEVERGAGKVDFGEPNVGELRRMSFQGRFGGFSVEGIGDASPRELDLDLAFGGGAFDLRGGWTADADIAIKYGSGGLAVILPQELQLVGIEGVDGIGADEAARMEVPPPTLRLTVDGDKPENIEFVVQ